MGFSNPDSDVRTLVKSVYYLSQTTHLFHSVTVVLSAGKQYLDVYDKNKPLFIAVLKITSKCNSTPHMLRRYFVERNIETVQTVILKVCPPAADSD